MARARRWSSTKNLEVLTAVGGEERDIKEAKPNVVKQLNTCGQAVECEQQNRTIALLIFLSAYNMSSS